MLFLNGKWFGSDMATNGEKITAMYYLGEKIWQALSKYWRRKEKWKRNQKW